MGKPRQSGDGRSLAGTNDPSMPPRRDAGEPGRSFVMPPTRSSSVPFTWRLRRRDDQDIHWRKSERPADYIFPRVGGVNPDGSPRRLTTMFYLREIPMLYPGIRRRRRRYALGRRRHVVSKLLFEPFMEIWDTNAPGYQQVQQALRHIVASQLLLALSRVRRHRRP